MPAFFLRCVNSRSGHTVPTVATPVDELCIMLPFTILLLFVSLSSQLALLEACWSHAVCCYLLLSTHYRYPPQDGTVCTEVWSTSIAILVFIHVQVPLTYLRKTCYTSYVPNVCVLCKLCEKQFYFRPLKDD